MEKKVEGSIVENMDKALETNVVGRFRAMAKVNNIPDRIRYVYKRKHIDGAMTHLVFPHDRKILYFTVCVMAAGMFEMCRGYFDMITNSNKKEGF
mmetsp:Transcript_6283/g.11185  ORF Transcript_6283/g.11185 Transcript_6283/m.11185 type:complete len:95 (+) Transcript_6283:113-397(+)|eukprot:CAMPEP_0182442466 /NCGR_PEP_ID=MMETSP1172-20130603/1378_1 /TAXON_ID=708627 /ORGANISM="Timspurckia oligopyrenoides, Strain CCMP3278" /LENGTH=94 /DNA_ID=CAMNT_0024637337 /DNA_START=111 /DNA_END=395 /DNA_ORIENTATION=-